LKTIHMNLEVPKRGGDSKYLRECLYTFPTERPFNAEATIKK